MHLVNPSGFYEEKHDMINQQAGILAELGDVTNFCRDPPFSQECKHLKAYI